MIQILVDDRLIIKLCVLDLILRDLNPLFDLLGTFRFPSREPLPQHLNRRRENKNAEKRTLLPPGLHDLLGALHIDRQDRDLALRDLIRHELPRRAVKISVDLRMLKHFSVARFLLELFAGSGAFGIEAISRGAQHVTFVDNNFRCAQTIKANLESLGVDESKYGIMKTNALSVPHSSFRSGEKFDIIFLDPPYSRGLAKNCLINIDSYDIVSPVGLVIIEHFRNDSLAASLDRLVMEKERRYAEAAESYKKAFTLDAFSAAAQEGQSRATRLEKETKFAAAKAAGDEALKARDWNKAIVELQNALKVYPQKPEVQAQLKVARESAHKESVQKALARGFEYEKAYQWREARDAYNETMQLDPDHAEAKEGYTRAGTVIRALLQYEKYIESAEQQANKADFQGAIRRFNEAMAVKPSYLVNSDRVQQLHNLLMAQNKPVEVTFKSDGNTWVQITNFRAPQKIDNELVVKILPGDYEVIGRRKGYRDVNMLLQVRNGVPPPVVTIACKVSSDRN